MFLNYTLQLSFVLVLARPFRAENAALLGALSMSNPESLAWGLEMWGYALLGVATWLSAPALLAPGIWSRAAYFVFNGPVSLLAALATACSRGWLLNAGSGRLRALEPAGGFHVRGGARRAEVIASGGAE